MNTVRLLAAASLARDAGPNVPVASTVAQPRVIGLKRAHAIAVHAAPGSVTASELEREPGGSGMRYSFVKASPVYRARTDLRASTVAFRRLVVNVDCTLSRRHVR